jgi:hypothetical protein
LDPHHERGRVLGRGVFDDGTHRGERPPPLLRAAWWKPDLQRTLKRLDGVSRGRAFVRVIHAVHVRPCLRHEASHVATSFSCRLVSHASSRWRFRDSAALLADAPARSEGPTEDRLGDGRALAPGRRNRDRSQEHPARAGSPLHQLSCPVLRPPLEAVWLVVGAGCAHAGGARHEPVDRGHARPRAGLPLAGAPPSHAPCALAILRARPGDSGPQPRPSPRSMVPQGAGGASWTGTASGGGAGCCPRRGLRGAS